MAEQSPERDWIITGAGRPLGEEQHTVSDQSPNERVEALAETLHRAESQVVLEWFNVARPKWFALMPAYKSEIRDRARRLTERYENG